MYHQTCHAIHGFVMISTKNSYALPLNFSIYDKKNYTFRLVEPLFCGMSSSAIDKKFMHLWMWKMSSIFLGFKYAGIMGCETAG